MTREEFVSVLYRIKSYDYEGYSYKIVGNKIVLTGNSHLNLNSLKTLPPDVKFHNGGGVDLGSLETLSPGVEFKNGGQILLNSLKTIPPGVVFNNRGDVRLDLLMGKWDGWFGDWNGNIEGIEPNRLLNKMIADGLFDRR